VPAAANRSTVGEATSISRAPTFIERYGNIVFRWATHLFAWLTVILVLYIVYTISRQALPALSKYGWGFITGTTWDPNTRE
jgi:phosphate transport system permease protein